MEKSIHNTLPISHYWGLVKDMDNSQKLELVSLLIDSMKPVVAAMQFEAASEDYFPDMEKEYYSPEEAYGMVMKDIKAIYNI